MTYKPMDLVDNSWTCGCGALNAAYLKNCGRCNKPNPKLKKDE
jgi:hypothetical protein